MADLLINNVDAKNYGIRMGKNFIDSLEAPVDQRDYISNEVRTEDGIRIIPVKPTKSSRTVTLEFQIMGVANNGKTAHEDYESKVDKFNELCDNGFMTIQVPKSRSDVYRLYSQRKSSSYSKGKANLGEVGKISVKFLEPNPSKRGAFDSYDNDHDTAKLALPTYESLLSDQ